MKWVFCIFSCILMVETTGSFSTVNNQGAEVSVISLLVSVTADELKLIIFVWKK